MDPSMPDAGGIGTGNRLRRTLPNNQLCAPVPSTAGRKAICGTCSGPTREWHLDLLDSLAHTEFNLRPRSRQAIVPHGPPLGHAGLEAVGAVGDAVHGDGPEHLLVEC